MKKSIKRFLVMTQVLGWSALVATACTDNDKSVSKTADVGKDSTKTDNKDTPPPAPKEPAGDSEHH